MTDFAQDIAFALARAIRHAQSIPNHGERLRFLRGVVLLAGDTAEIQPLRALLQHIESCDERLDSLARQEWHRAVSFLPPGHMAPKSSLSPL